MDEDGLEGEVIDISREGKRYIHTFVVYKDCKTAGAYLDVY